MKIRGRDMVMLRKWQETQFALSHVTSVGFAVEMHRTMFCSFISSFAFKPHDIRMGGRIPIPHFLPAFLSFKFKDSWECTPAIMKNLDITVKTVAYQTSSGIDFLCLHFLL